MNVDFALSVQQLDTLPALAMSDGAVAAFLVVAHVVEAGRRRRWTGRFACRIFDLWFLGARHIDGARALAENQEQ